MCHHGNEGCYEIYYMVCHHMNDGRGTICVVIIEVVLYVFYYEDDGCYGYIISCVTTAMKVVMVILHRVTPHER